MGEYNTCKKQTIFKIPEGATHLIIEEHEKIDDIPEGYEMSFVDDSYIGFPDEVKQGTFNYDDTSLMFFEKSIKKGSLTGEKKNENRNNI